MRAGRYLCVGCIFGLGVSAHRQPASAQAPRDAVAVSHPTPQQLRRILDSVRVAFNVPALAGAIVTRDSVLLSDAVGIRRVGGTTLVTPEDYFHIGSDFKSMTAGWVAQQVDAGRISWTTTITDVFPNLQADMRAEYRSVTLLELLSHQSGLPANPTAGACRPERPVRVGCGFDDRAPRPERLKVLAWAVRQPPVSKRGTFAYSNVNYMIAAAMVEARLDEEFESSIVTRLLAPLGMKTVGFGAAGTPGREDQPWGHLPTAAAVRPIPPGPYADLPEIYGPAGTVHMSIRDWGLWIRTVLRAEAGLPSPWKPATARMLTSRVIEVDTSDAYALGWAVGEQTWGAKTQRILGHNGSNGMHFAAVRVIPAAGLGVIVVTNQGGPAATDAVVRTADRLIELFRTAR